MLRADTGQFWHVARLSVLTLMCVFVCVCVSQHCAGFNVTFYFSGKTRTKEKYRVVYTDHQRLELEKEFHFNRYITIRRKSELAVNLGLSERQVRKILTWMKQLMMRQNIRT